MSPKLLLVEDVDDVRTTVARMLARRYDVTTAANAHEAIAAFEKQGPFPVVLSDYSMPDVNGLDLLREVHTHSPDSVGILLTGVTDLEIAVAALHADGVYRFLSKPCGFEVMTRAIDDALAHHDELVTRGLANERLAFEKETLESFADLLEEHIDHQAETLRQMHGFAARLCAAESLHDIVTLAAGAVSSVLAGRSVHVQVWDDTPDHPVIESSVGPEMQSRLHCEPLVTRDGKIGEIVVDQLCPAGNPLKDGELRLLASIASSTAVAAHNEYRRRERDHAQHATIVALARLAEQRDGETGKHLDRVAAYCKLVANGLRADGFYQGVITDSWIEDLERSSVLHDIGKVGIPDSILLKPGRLSPSEWEIMKTHAQLGADTLDSVIQQFGQQGFLTMGRDIASGHHERWDGGGYPRALRGNDIPLAARILAIADVYDALTTVRPYKHAWSHAEAVEWIRARSGSQFDPEVVAAFLKRGNEADGIRARLKDADIPAM